MRAYKIALIVALSLLAIGLFLVLLQLVTGSSEMTWLWLSSFYLIAGFVLLAISFQGFQKLKNLSYTMWIFTAVTFSLFYPQYLTGIGTFSFKSLIIPLLQIMMFGVGTTMGLSDFAGVIRMPKAVFIGLAGHFIFMPLIGYTIAHTFGFSPEIAAGIILVGSVPCGLASNVLSYLANANVALSVTLTAVGTLLAPVITPLLMQLLAGEYIPIDFLAMMWNIIQIVILPMTASLLYNHFLGGKFEWLDKAMPVVSIVSIVTIIAVITAAGRESLLTVGPLLMLACFIHNITGYILGYTVCKAFKMNEKTCRTIALEVGLQNTSLATGLALKMGKVATVGLAPAVFSPIMNISGSTLATWWQSKPAKDQPVPLVQN